MVLCKLDSRVKRRERYLPHSSKFSVSMMIMKSWLASDKQRVVSGRTGDWSDRRQWIMSPCHCLKTGQHLSLTVSPVSATDSLHSPCGSFSILSQGVQSLVYLVHLHFLHMHQVYTTSWFLSKLQQNQNLYYNHSWCFTSFTSIIITWKLLLRLILVSLLSSYLIWWWLVLGLGWMAGGTMAVFDVDKCWWL